MSFLTTRVMVFFLTQQNEDICFVRKVGNTVYQISGMTGVWIA